MGRIISGEGPRNASIMLIGQRPGIEEVRRGRPFVGKSGVELDRYLRVYAGLDRHQCYVTNLVKTFEGDDEILPEEIERDAPLLKEEIDTVQPQYVGLVGLYSARAFLGPDLDLDWAHGLMWPRGYLPYDLMPVYHPAAGLHLPQNAARCAWDFEQFGRMVRREPLPVHHLSDTVIGHYSSVTDIQIESTMGCDTEGTPDAPWCFSLSSRPGKGVVLKGRYYALRHVVVHAMLHDMPVLHSLGVSYTSWSDTHLMAALLGLEPHGLKALARRHCGMVMSDYADVVRDARREKALEYLSKVLDWMPLDPPKPVKPKRKVKTLTEELESAITITQDSDGGTTTTMTDDDIPF